MTKLTHQGTYEKVFLLKQVVHCCRPPFVESDNENDRALTPITQQKITCRQPPRTVHSNDRSRIAKTKPCYANANTKAVLKKIPKFTASFGQIKRTGTVLLSQPPYTQGSLADTDNA